MAAAGSASLTNANAKLAADVSIAVNNTWYDGPSVSLAAGTWYVAATAHIDNQTANPVNYARITDGTTHYASGAFAYNTAGGYVGQIAMSTIITLAATTTIKIQAIVNAGGGTALLKASTSIGGNSSGNNATQITALKVA